MSISEKSKVNKKLRYAEYYDMQEIMDKLYSDSQQGKKFTNLMSLILTRENILLAYRNIKKNAGSHTIGTDGKTIKDIENREPDWLVEKVRNKLKFYKPSPVRRVEIPKPNGKLRPLGIPTIMDRLIQQCILQILEPICEAKFFERNNGFRPNRSAEQAIAQCYKMVQRQGLHYVVDIDIKGFFDNVNHHKLKKQLWNIGIQDKKLICIIQEMLKAPIVMPNGDIMYPDKGTPQGGILSPLLANVVLNEFDWWTASQWELFPTEHQYAEYVNSNGSIDQGAKYQSLKRYSNLKEMYIVRYADDFKIFCRNFNDAKKVFMASKLWLKDRLKLDINEEKSKVINLKKQYSEFLGFKIRATKKGKKYVIKSHMKDKAIKTECEKLKKIIKEIRCPKDGIGEYKTIQKYNSTVLGIHNYYQVTTHISADCNKIAFIINRVLRKTLGKRLKKEGSPEGFIKEKYGKSKQLRYVHETAIIPIGYIQTKQPRYKNRKINKYTPEGRAIMYEPLQLNMSILLKMMRTVEANRSIEYSDNRISRYCAQRGKCAITGKVMEYESIHCHHIKPRHLGGTDEYNNLIIIDKNIHILIHATNAETIRKYMELLKCDGKQLEKVNKMRTLAGNNAI
ncbi:group II intron reverse transcriptase/maturase [Hungatella effluvii]|uniref:Group II intron reverse transcriptase/maturase n=1 Tax=Hungatella effluvii TaxID=1096246 RepID=A0A2V3Y1Y7_9FIRM|nr:group II intron reverse transcriptase/maturase [Hungatella effluvii]PXX51984.1 group II intron reverse transcriptase/maturase [Hungatella effluvii]